MIVYGQSLRRIKFVRVGSWGSDFLGQGGEEVFRNIFGYFFIYDNNNIGGEDERVIKQGNSVCKSSELDKIKRCRNLVNIQFYLERRVYMRDQ